MIDSEMTRWIVYVIEHTKIGIKLFAIGMFYKFSNLHLLPTPCYCEQSTQLIQKLCDMEDT